MYPLYKSYFKCYGPNSEMEECLNALVNKHSFLRNRKTEISFRCFSCVHEDGECKHFMM